MRPLPFWVPLLAGLCVAACSVAPPRTAAGGHSGAPWPPEESPLKAQSELQKQWQSVYENLVGLPYRFGGAGRQGFDCSGLVQYAYRRFDGRRLPRTSIDQYRAGRGVERRALATGDLLFYRTDGSGPSHVGIYLWSGWFLHAANGEGVTLTRLDDPYYEKRYLGARRL